MERYSGGTKAQLGAGAIEQVTDNSNPLADPEERRVIFAALDSFYQYRKNAHFNTTHRRRQNLYALPSSQWRILAEPPFSLLETLSAIDDAIDHNAALADEIHNLGRTSFGLPEYPEKLTPVCWQSTAKPSDVLKAHSTLRQFYRDWSAEGYHAEVKPILDNILTDLRATMPQPHGTTPLPSILLPGAGLGRLLLELCLAGYSTTGNEISYHQLLASNFILNTTQRANQYLLYPFATTFTNNLSRTNQLRCVTIPSIHPATAIASALQSGKRVGEMNMTAGDFMLSYSTPEHADSFDAVLTVYFIDTAPNLIRYIQTVRHCLKPGGVWINIGPLLWHFDDRITGQGNGHGTDKHSITAISGEDTGVGEPGSFELTNEEVLLLVEQMGFAIEKQEVLDANLNSSTTVSGEADGDTRGGRRNSHGLGYIQDPTSMLQNLYRCSHWVARKTG